MKSLKKLATLAKKLATQDERLLAGIESGRVRRVQHVRAANGAIKRNTSRNEFADQMLSRPGPIPRPAYLVRSHVVSSRFNDFELSEFVGQCKSANLPQGEFLRRSWLQDKRAPVTPEFNRLVNIATKKSVGNLTQISGHIDTPDFKLLVAEVKRDLDRFSTRLVSATNEAVSAASGPVFDEELKSRRGPLPLPSGDARYNVVCIRVNQVELNQLDSERGQFKRGEWVRMCWQDLQTSKVIPALGKSSYEPIKRCAESINKIAHHINQGISYEGKYALVEAEVAALGKAIKQAERSLT